MTLRRTASEADAPRDASSDQPQPRNATPYDRPFPRANATSSPSSTSDSKRSHAAQLARSLGSSSPWSQTVMPQTYGTLPVEGETSNSGYTDYTDTMQSNLETSEHDTDPPPAYSNVPQVHELPATPVVTRPSALHGVSPSTNGLQNNLAQRQADEEQGGDDQALLSRIQPRWQKWRSRWKKQPNKASRQRRRRKLCLLIIFGLFAAFILCILLRSANYNSSLGSPSEPSATLVPTGPVYERHETVRSIDGAYKLYDRLELSSTTGSIDIEVEPQPGDRPAVLILASDTGGIKLRLSSGFLHRQNRPPRAIYTEIRTITGSVAAEILLGHGSYALVDTGTGGQVLSVMTSGIGVHDQVSNLTTSSKTGMQQITVSSLDNTEKTISNLRAEHHSYATALLDIAYPPVWRGEVHARALLTGSVTVTGDRLEYTKRVPGFFSSAGLSEVIAHRGQLKNLQSVQVVSHGTGSVNFRC